MNGLHDFFSWYPHICYQGCKSSLLFDLFAASQAIAVWEVDDQAGTASGVRHSMYLVTGVFEPFPSVRFRSSKYFPLPQTSSLPLLH